MIRKLLALLVLLVVGAGAFMMWHRMQPPPPGLDEARQKLTEKGLYMLAIAPAAEPVQVGPMHEWVLSVKDPAGQPVSGATVRVDGGMPQHGHGLPTAPVATALAEAGSFRIEGVKFNMGGWWELKLMVDGPQGQDAATFNIVLP